MQKTTTEQKKLRGTAQRCRVAHEMTYEPIDSVPAPSFELTDTGMEYYNQFCEILMSRSALTMADIPIITRASRWYEIYKEADAEVRLNGATHVTQTGYTAQSGYYTVMEKTDDRIMKIETLYGMNLLSRQKINFKPTKTKNPIDEL